MLLPLFTGVDHIETATTVLALPSGSFDHSGQQQRNAEREEDAAGVKDGVVDSSSSHGSEAGAEGENAEEDAQQARQGEIEPRSCSSDGLNVSSVRGGSSRPSDLARPMKQRQSTPGMTSEASTSKWIPLDAKLMQAMTQSHISSRLAPPTPPWMRGLSPSVSTVTTSLERSLSQKASVVSSQGRLPSS
jgi:hypothetical protein